MKKDASAWPSKFIHDLSLSSHLWDFTPVGGEFEHSNGKDFKQNRYFPYQTLYQFHQQPLMRSQAEGRTSIGESSNVERAIFLIVASSLGSYLRHFGFAKRVLKASSLD
jgi:hypothetical protein